MPKLKPGSRLLLLVGLLVWGFIWSLFRDSTLERDLYDYQVALVRQRQGEPQKPSSLVLGAIDREAFRAGLRAEDIPRIAEALEGTTVDVTTQDLAPYFEPDADGLLRSVRLYTSTSAGPKLSPPLKTFLDFRGINPEDVRIQPGAIVYPGGILKTDREGRFFPFFHVVDNYSYQVSYARYLPGSSEQGSVEFQVLEPASVLNLMQNEISLKERLILLGLFLNEADSVEFDTPAGDMVRIELYGALMSSMMGGHYFTPLSWQANFFAAALFLVVLCLLLPGRRTSSSLGWWCIWVAGWLALNQAVFVRGSFLNQSSLILTGLAILVVHLLLRSWRVQTLLNSLGGRAPLQQSGEEIIASILFTNLPETIQELESENLERAQAARAAHSRAVGYAVNQYGGRLVDLQGDAQMIAFGLEGESNHQHQAVACALELVDKVNLLLGVEPGQNVVHCGIVTGPVATGQVGGGQYRSVAAIGDTTNSAARLMGQAKKKSLPVLASAETVAPLELRATTSEVGELSVKGREEPLKVWQVEKLDSPPAVQSAKTQSQAKNLPLAAFFLSSIACSFLAIFLSQKLPFDESVLDAMTPSSKAAPIIFAGLDEESLEEFGWPWPRSFHAQVLKNCVDAGAICVFLDFLFEDESDPDEDKALVEAVNRSPEIVVAAAALEDGLGNPIEPDLLQGLKAGKKWGLINHATSNTGAELRFALWELPLDQGHKMGPGVVQQMMEILRPGYRPELNHKGEFLIRWGPKPLTTSYHRLLNPNDPVFKKMQGKIIICGDNLSGRSDLFETPVGPLKGAMIHAMSLQTLITNQLLVDKSNNLSTWVLVWALGCAILFLSWRQTGVTGQLALLAGGVVAGLGLVKLASVNGYFLGSSPMIVAATSVVFGWILAVTEANHAMVNYIPRKLQEQLERDGTVADITTVGTILLTDIRGYTTLSEGRSPSEILALLNSYHAKTAAVYEKYGGHLITYQGDAQIVVFGPLDPVDNAVHAAVKSAQELPEIVEQVAQEAGLDDGILRVGSGITTGEITLSLMGTAGQLQYSVFGAPVRQAHHLQSLSDTLDESIILDARSSYDVNDVLSLNRYERDGQRIFTI